MDDDDGDYVDGDGGKVFTFFHFFLGVRLGGLRAIWPLIGQSIKEVREDYTKAFVSNIIIINISSSKYIGAEWKTIKTESKMNSKIIEMACH